MLHDRFPDVYSWSLSPSTQRHRHRNNFSIHQHSSLHHQTSPHNQREAQEVSIDSPIPQSTSSSHLNNHPYNPPKRHHFPTLLTNQQINRRSSFAGLALAEWVSRPRRLFLSF
ncbi:uncharacterized protein BKA78DRAFT_147569 [Phyllosticta capitalensis]|uniref:uncharacterized protein n=1 Tax=Phyllosticta capitalensis TaxID=121624 RepID=UPI00312FABCF